MNGLISIKCENEDLRKMFNKLNRDYFGNKLVLDEIGYFNEISMRTVAQAQFDGWNYKIAVNPICKIAKNHGYEKTIIETIIHEMIHIWQYQNDRLDKEYEGHGKYFKAVAMKIMEKSPEYEITRFASKNEMKLLNLVKIVKTKKMMGM